MSSPLRLLALAVGLAALLAALALGWEFARFGVDIEATARHLEQEVRETVSERIREVESLATQVAREGDLVDEAAGSPTAVPALFERLRLLSEPVDQHRVAVTVYVPSSSPTAYRVLAWSDGPGEKDLAAARLSGPATLFVAPGHAGLRLIRVEPIERAGRRVAVAVAETVLAAIDRSSPTAERRLPTRFGPVAVIEQYASARDDLTLADGFVIATTTGAPLLEVLVNQDDLAHARRRVRSRLLAAALLPIPLAVGLLSGMPLARRRTAPGFGAWLAWTALAGVPLAVSAAGLMALGRLGGAPVAAFWAIASFAAVGFAALVPGHLWWRPARPRRIRDSPVGFVFEHLVGGVLLALAIELTARLLQSWITPDALDRGQYVLFPFSFDGLLQLGTLLMSEVALGWTAVGLLAAASVRWRHHRAYQGGAAAAACWLTPTAILLLSGRSFAGAAPAAAAAVAVLAVVFALLARWVRRYYRRTTQSMRLLLAFVAILAPLVVIYPLTAATADRTKRQIIADQFAPATARHPQDLRGELARAQRDVDRLAGLDLAELVTRIPSIDSQAAFLVWSQTSLFRSRVISDVELFGADGGLLSRFAFNLPEYLYRTSQQTRQGTGCQWEVFGEVTPFGAEERLMLHAERGVCDNTGRVLGGVVIHVASNDYQALPFVSSINPYYEMLGVPEAPSSSARLPDLGLAVYGWSQQPIFTSGQVPWPVSQATFDHLYRHGTPFWESVVASGRRYEVHFSQDRAGIYALGYPKPTAVEHATRLAEIAALVAVLFVGLQVGALVYAPTAQHRQAPLHVLFHEVRTSFYRKLFLFFVAVAVVPVLVAALTFGGYMTSRFRADVEHEAANTVAVARRVLQELLAGDPSAANSRIPTDDVMVWIRQVINQDVNYFEGSELVATSQRDLFDSGLLPTRTPATVYRDIALGRRPTLVAEDRIGTFQYVVAAVPVTSRGPGSILTIPLAPRQREFERELDNFNRRVLVGAVLVVLFAAVLGSSLAGRVADPVARLTRATRQISAGRLDVRIASDTADELRTLVDDFNSMATTLVAQRAELARTNQLKAWNEMARQVAHEIKNPLTPVQLATEHLQQVHNDRGRPLGTVLDQCATTILSQVRLLRQIASEFANFAGAPTSHPEPTNPATLLASIIDPYRLGLAGRVHFDADLPADLPDVWADRTLLARALTNLVENAVQAMPSGGTLRVRAQATRGHVTIIFTDTGSGMDDAAVSRAFEPYFSTKAGGSGLGLANAKRNIEREGGTIAIASAVGSGTTVTVTLPRPGAHHDAGGVESTPSR